MGQIGQKLMSGAKQGADSGTQGQMDEVSNNLFGGGVRGTVATGLDAFGKSMSNFANAQAGNAGNPMVQGFSDLSSAIMNRGRARGNPLTPPDPMKIGTPAPAPVFNAPAPPSFAGGVQPNYGSQVGGQNGMLDGWRKRF